MDTKESRKERCRKYRETHKEQIKKYWVIIKSVGFNVPERTVVNNAKEAKLLGVQIHADFIHTRHNLSLSYVLGFLITGIFAIFTLYYEDMFSRNDSTAFLIFLLLIGFLAVCQANYTYRERINKIYDEINTLTDNDPYIGEDM